MLAVLFLQPCCCVGPVMVEEASDVSCFYLVGYSQPSREMNIFFLTNKSVVISWLILSSYTSRERFRIQNTNLKQTDLFEWLMEHRERISDVRPVVGDVNQIELFDVNEGIMMQKSTIKTTTLLLVTANGRKINSKMVSIDTLIFCSVIFSCYCKHVD